MPDTPELTVLPAQADGASGARSGSGERIPVPSGQEVTLQDVIWNVPGPEGLTYRFRFVAPAISQADGEIDYDTAVNDMFHLCQEFAIARLPEGGPQPNQIVISLSDRPVPFGETAPEVTQFFEAFRYKDGICEWEIF